MRLTKYDGTKVTEVKNVEDNLLYYITLNPADKYNSKDTSNGINVELTGKELKDLIELINTFSKLQSSPLPTNLFELLGKMNKFTK